MNIEEIRKKAPEGATHYISFKCKVIYFSLKNNKMRAYAANQWDANVPFLIFSKFFFRWYIYNVFGGTKIRIKPL